LGDAGRYSIWPQAPLLPRAWLRSRNVPWWGRMRGTLSYDGRRVKGCAPGQSSAAFIFARESSRLSPSGLRTHPKMPLGDARGLCAGTLSRARARGRGPRLRRGRGQAVSGPSRRGQDGRSRRPSSALSSPLPSALPEKPGACCAAATVDKPVLRRRRRALGRGSVEGVRPAPRTGIRKRLLTFGEPPRGPRRGQSTKSPLCGKRAGPGLRIATGKPPAKGCLPQVIHRRKGGSAAQAKRARADPASLSPRYPLQRVWTGAVPAKTSSASIFAGAALKDGSRLMIDNRA